MGRDDKRTLSKCSDKSHSHSSSIDSFDLFESVYSEYSDCEFCEDRRRRRNKARGYSTVTLSPSSGSAGNTSHTAMELEGAPLLSTVRPPPPAYKAIVTDSDSLGPGELSSSEIISTMNKQKEKTKPERKKHSSLVTIFSVWNTIMGSSLLTMAWGVERAGLPAALLLFALMAAICLYTAAVLLTINRHHGNDTCEVPALCRALLGRGAEIIAHTFSLIVLIGANVVYWVLITNFLYYTGNYFTELTAPNSTAYNSTILCPKQVILNGSLLLATPSVESSPYWGLQTTVPIYVAILMLPLLSFGNVSFFTKFNSLGTLSAVYLLIFVFVKGYAWGINIPTIEAHPGKDAAVLSGMLALSFYIHNIIITIMSNNERQENNGRDLTIAFVLVTVTYTFVGGVFYICFPLAKSCIADNILNNFEMHDVLTAIARVLLLFQVVTVYPLVAYMLRCEALLLLPFRETKCLSISINALIVLLCILVACFCPNIGTIIRYTGAISGLVHIFALPSLLQVRSLKLRGELTWWKTAFYVVIVVFGAVNLLMQFFITET